MYWIYIIGLVFVVIIGITQSYFGYNEHKVLGWIFPIVFIGFNIWFLMNGTLEFSISDIFRPFIGLAALSYFWEKGYKKKQKELSRELDKMKAKDQQNMQ
ncbi:hypothetical protein ACRCJR_09680 [Aerococcus urinaeequi]|uniref:hypothetical protein n=1 Tax=Aerococcus urinaeequi TaxID=51665 RepID=UPI003D6B1F0C